MAVEKREVRVGLGRLDRPMTKTQALRWGNRNMPKDLRMAGFETMVFQSSLDIEGSLFFRVNYGKR